MRRGSVFVAVGLASSAARCGSDKECNDVVGSSIDLRYHLQLAPSQLDIDTVTVCQNQACWTEPFSDATVSAEGTGSLVEIWITGAGDYTDGDVWTVSMESASNEVVFRASQTATYETYPQPCRPGSYVKLTLDLQAS